jgi:hypothetical protein
MANQHCYLTLAPVSIARFSMQSLAKLVTLSCFLQVVQQVGAPTVLQGRHSVEAMPSTPSIIMWSV